MLREHKTLLERSFRVLDILSILLSFLVAYALRFGPEALGTFSFPTQYMVFFFAYLALWFYVSTRAGLYVSRRVARVVPEAWEVCKATAVTLVGATIPAFFVREDPLSRLFVLHFWTLATLSLALFRFALREWLKAIRRRGYNHRNVLIIGRNERAAQIASRIDATPELGLQVLGFLDVTTNGHHQSVPYDFDLIGHVHDLEKILRREVVDEVFITLPLKSFYADIGDVISLCETVGVGVKIPADLFPLKAARSIVTQYDDIPILHLFTGPDMNWQLSTKRAFDLVASVGLLVGLSPLFLLIALLIKATSKGPVFFRQPRVGYNGRVFNCLKFRTMVANAEDLRDSLMGLNEQDGPVFKIQDDPRVTRLGRVLRKTSFDELPQLLNVFSGHMSIVGPRPPLPSEVNQYELAYRRRLSIRPGLTCIWQVSGRNGVTFEEWMRMDHEYISHWSLWLDFKILVKTIPAVLKGTGA